MKNNLLQAVAAIEYANSKNLKLFSSMSVEPAGDDNLKNLRALFAKARHVLIEHRGMSDADFLLLVGQMDLSMCVPFSKAFCVVAADSVATGIPTVVSQEIEWASRVSMADPTDADDIVRVMRRLLTPVVRRWAVWNNRCHLCEFYEESRGQWLAASGE